MYFVYFSWWKDFRVPTSTTKVKVATAGKACGVWYGKLNTFQFQLPAGICAADMTFMGTSGVHDFHLTLDSAKASHIAWEHADYPHTTDAFLLERAFSQVGKRPQVMDLPLPRVAGMTRYHNLLTLKVELWSEEGDHILLMSLDLFRPWVWNRALPILQEG